MPSYRVTLTLGALHPGTRPDAVLPAAMRAARQFTTVEAGDVQVVGGRARVVVRFTGDDTEVAAQIGRHVASVVERAVQVLAWGVTERVKGAWHPVDSPPFSG